MVNSKQNHPPSGISSGVSENSSKDPEAPKHPKGGGKVQDIHQAGQIQRGAAGSRITKDEKGVGKSFDSA